MQSARETYETRPRQDEMKSNRPCVNLTHAPLNSREGSEKGKGIISMKSVTWYMVKHASWNLLHLTHFKRMIRTCFVFYFSFFSSMCFFFISFLSFLLLVFFFFSWFYYIFALLHHKTVTFLFFSFSLNGASPLLTSPFSFRFLMNHVHH